MTGGKIIGLGLKKHTGLQINHTLMHSAKLANRHTCNRHKPAVGFSLLKLVVLLVSMVENGLPDEIFGLLYFSIQLKVDGRPKPEFWE